MHIGCYLCVPFVLYAYKWVMHTCILLFEHSGGPLWISMSSYIKGCHSTNCFIANNFKSRPIYRIANSWKLKLVTEHDLKIKFLRTVKNGCHYHICNFLLQKRKLYKKMLAKGCTNMGNPLGLSKALCGLKVTHNSLLNLSTWHLFTSVSFLNFMVNDYQN